MVGSLFQVLSSVLTTIDRSMGDADGPIIAEKVYGALFAGDSEHLDPDAVPYALASAVKELRERGYHASRWAPYVHVGI